MQIADHAGCCSPDVKFFKVHGIIGALPPLPFALVELVIGFVHEKIKWNFKRACNLSFVDGQLEVWRDQSDNRHYVEIGACSVIVQIADRINMSPVEANFLLPQMSDWPSPARSEA